MNSFDYSKLKNRTKKVYAIGDLKLSSTGFAMPMIIISGTLIFISIIINCFICAVIDYWYINPFNGEDLNFWPLVFIVGIPLGIGLILYNAKIQNYRLFEFLFIYFKAKYAPTLSWDGKKVTHTQIKMDAFLESKEPVHKILTDKENKKNKKRRK